MTEVPDQYDPDSVERKWRERWQEMDVYTYADHEERPDYVIDTPPPYPTGNLHIGHGLGWCYIDFAARYHRLQGEDVLFPQGWDCHGLPTEVKVEENEDIHRTDVPREEFREMCVEHTETQIEAMKGTMLDLGFGIDWSAEYRTMDPEYWAKTQRSFVEMADYVYRDEHPVNWCPRCETAIADAEVENADREGTLYSITFEGVGNEDIEIATTRPELLPACVGMAVHPDDGRYGDRIGDTFEVPLFGQTVEVFADEAVDTSFGTGAVMVCTFGDKQDVDWWGEHDLALRTAFTEDGHLNEFADEFAGLTIEAAKDEIAAALRDSGHLGEEEPTEQSVGRCWRCDTPIEILSKEQWFVEIRQDEILEFAREVDWIPEHMYVRLEEWTEGMDWDWVISRQRVFATPIPAWECLDCGHWHIAEAEALPVDPMEDDPSVDACPECGASDWQGETDVMDTWMDSSITPLHVAGWPDDLDLADFDPVALRPQGHDIIRTWAFYTLLRTGAMTGEPPWADVLINGMVFGSDGNKMSKSRGNVVAPTEAIEEYSADAFRQSIALGGQPGSDIQFQWKEVTSSSRFATKLWNITKFTTRHVTEETPTVEHPAYRDADRWILSRASQVAEAVAADMEDYRFDAALRNLREFVWHDLADDYLELIKGRLYEGRPGERDAARNALYTAVSASVRMLSPFAPFLTEEAYHHLPGVEGSVHEADWPRLDMVDEAAQQRGQNVADVASVVRSWKSDRGMPLNEELDRLEVYLEDPPDEGPSLDTYDLSSAVNAPVYVETGTPNVEVVPVAVEPDHATIGPEFRDRAGEVVSALEEADPAAVRRDIETAGEVEVDVGGEVLVVDGDAVDIHEEHRAASGEEVAVLDFPGGTALVYP